jgi:gluconolactonase
MKIAVVMLCALSVAPAYGQGRQAAPPMPPATETVAPGIPGVVAAGTKVVVLKDGLQGAEGPVMLKDGSLIFTETQANRVTKIDQKGNFSTYLENTNRANGMALDSKGRLLATQAATVAVIAPKGSEAVLAGPYKSRPNDLVIDKKDGVYFTLTPGVFYIPPGGQAVQAGEAPSPHGIILSPDEKTLYVADSSGMYLIAFDVQADGKLTNRRNFGKYDGMNLTAAHPESHADGIAIDGDGRVYVGVETGVEVFSAQGKHLGLIPVSRRPQNLAFGGPGKKTLYLTGTGGSVFTVQMLSHGYMGRPR